MLSSFVYSEIKAQYLFEKETSEIKFPQYQDGSFSSNFKLGFYDYLSLLTDRSEYCYFLPTKLMVSSIASDLLYRVAVGSL